MISRLLTLCRHFWQTQGRSILRTLGLLLLVYAGVHAWQTRGVPSGQAPALIAQTADGASLDLSDWRARHAGRAVALYFWAEWCPVCRLQQHGITGLQADWPVLTVAMQSGDAQRVAAVLRQRALPWPTVVDPDGRLSRRFGLGAVPAFIVLDAQGRIRFVEVGYTSEAGMRLRLWWAQHL